MPRWIFFRALAAIYFSAFYSLLFQIKGLLVRREFCLHTIISRSSPRVSRLQTLVRAHPLLDSHQVRTR